MQIIINHETGRFSITMGPEQTISTLKNRIYSNPEHWYNKQLVYNRQPLNDTDRLSTIGLGHMSVVDMVPSVSSSSSAPAIASTIAQPSAQLSVRVRSRSGQTNQFGDSIAPRWNSCEPGLFFQAWCYNKMRDVVINWGMENFNQARDHNSLACPCCDSTTLDISAFCFMECQYKVDSRDWQEVNDGYVEFLEYNAWSGLDIQVSGLERGNCPICLTEMNESVILDCGHRFHEPCLNQWLERADTCPYCRARIVDEYD